MTYEFEHEIEITVSAGSGWSNSYDCELTANIELDDDQCDNIANEFVSEFVNYVDCMDYLKEHGITTLTKPNKPSFKESWFEDWIVENFAKEEVAEEPSEPERVSYEPDWTIPQRLWSTTVEDVVDQQIQDMAEKLFMQFMKNHRWAIDWEQYKDPFDCDYKRVTEAFIELLWQMGMPFKGDGKEY